MDVNEAGKHIQQRRIVRAASPGDVVVLDGVEWRVGTPFVEAQYHSGQELHGELCDATVRRCCTLTNVESSTQRKFRLH
jgi:hypothetical protein